jgi:hypothetical protein
MSTCVYEIICPKCGFVEGFNTLENYMVITCFRCGLELKLVNPLFQTLEDDEKD